MKNKISIITCLAILALLNTSVTASIPSFLRSLGIYPIEDSGEETQRVISSIPVLEELSGIRFSALVIDLPSGSPIAVSGEGIFPFNVPEVFFIAYAIDMMPADSLLLESPQETETISSCTAEDVARALQIIHSGINMPSVREILANPEMGEGQASSVGEGWDLYGWVDSGENHKSFVLIATSPEGRELGLILLSDDLCCEEKGDLAMMLLWEVAQGL